MICKFPGHWRYLKYSISKRNAADQKKYVKLYNYFENNQGAPFWQCPHFSGASAAYVHSYVKLCLITRTSYGNNTNGVNTTSTQKRFTN